MKNRPGPPVEGDDFFDRPRDLARIQRELGNGNNLLLTAPRRVGKTSLVLRLAELCRAGGWAAAFLNVEDCVDEIDFAEKLVDGLRREGVHPEFLTNLGGLFQKARKALGGMKVGAGVDVELGEVEDPDHGTLARALESMFRRIEQDPDREVLIALDEMPEFLLALARQDQGAERVSRFLHWLRHLRQTYRSRLHWIFLGSIGLDSFVDDRYLRKAINDLVTVGLDALTDQEADQFLEILGHDNGLPLPPEARQLILARVGWPLPHHLQVVFHALVDIGADPADPAVVDRAVEHLLRPEHISQFDTWRQRLDEQFSALDAGTAKTMLRQLCRHPQGRSRAQLLDALMAARPTDDPAAAEERLAKLLVVLQRDGYLLESGGSYAFRSFLLRAYWYQREVR